jgi:membrane dipeptidase
LFVRRQTAEIRGDYCFTTPEEAHQAAQAQLAMHRRWQQENLIDVAEFGSVRGETQRSKFESGNLKLTLAIEGAGCIRNLDDATAFRDAGVRIISLAWAEGSRWAGGDQSGGDVTSEGRELIGHLDELQMIHDVSHLSERAFSSLLERTSGPIVASHSNCRELLPGSKYPERHLSDGQIRALAARPNSLIGINLFARFILPPGELARRRATIADILMHINHIEQLTGRRDLVALGSDFDSGFSTELLPSDLQGPQDLVRLAEALSDAKWAESDISHFANAWESIVTAEKFLKG